MQVNTLIYYMGDQADDILLSFGLSAEDRKKHITVKEKFEGHFVIHRNTIYERAKFNQRKQLPGNPLTIHYSTLWTCRTLELNETMIRDRIVVGIADATLAEKLQPNP